MARPQKKYTENEKEEIQKAYTNSQNTKEQKRLLCLKLRIVQGLSSKEIAEITGFSKSFVDEIVSKYNRLGLDKIKAKKQGGNRRNLTDEQEKELLSTFVEESESGKIVEVGDIVKAYEKLVGRSVAKSVVYRMLKRHNWRKIMPRNKHPKKASIEVIDAYKKNH